ncbi:MAG TPA: HMG-box domain-containing protein [Terriglobales bacterium]|nr:HMG-box domain-containing protein [Terriglobales bacterium]
MRLVVAVSIVALAISPAFAKANAGSDKMKACGAQWSAMSADQKKGTTYKQFTADCMSGKTAMPGVPVATTDKSKMTPQERMKACSSEWKSMSAADKAKTTYKAFSSTCLKKT